MAHLFTLQLCQLQLKDEPEQLISRVVGVEEQPEVLVHAVVHVQADHSQAGWGTDAVVGTVPGGIITQGMYYLRESLIHANLAS